MVHPRGAASSWTARRHLLVLLPLAAIGGHWLGGVSSGPGPVGWSDLHAGLLLLVGGPLAAAWVLGDRQRRAMHASMQATIDAQHLAVAELQRTEALKTELLSIVSHEFRTPLTGIMGFSRTLQAQIASGTASPEAAALALDRIERNSHRLARVVGNMLAVSTDVDLVNTADHDLRPTVQRVVRELSSVSGGDTSVVTDIPDDLTVHSSAEHLRLILTNLVDNAIKFADRGTVATVRAREVGDQVTLTFSNEGPPIPEEMADRIFAPFVQVDSTETRRYEGLGLGLHVVRRLCSAYGGELELLCQGRTVVLAITLPAGRDRPVQLHSHVDVATS